MNPFYTSVAVVGSVVQGGVRIYLYRLTEVELARNGSFINAISLSLLLAIDSANLNRLHFIYTVHDPLI